MEVFMTSEEKLWFIKNENYYVKIEEEKNFILNYDARSIQTKQKIKFNLKFSFPFLLYFNEQNPKPKKKRKNSSTQKLKFRKFIRFAFSDIRKHLCTANIANNNKNLYITSQESLKSSKKKKKNQFFCSTFPSIIIWLLLFPFRLQHDLIIICFTRKWEILRTCSRAHWIYSTE